MPTPVAVLDKHAAVSGVAIVTGQLGVDRRHRRASSRSGPPAAVLRVRAAPRRLDVRPARREPFLTGFESPVPVLIAAPTGRLLVGDWATGKVYAIAGRQLLDQDLRRATDASRIEAGPSGG